MKKSEGKIKKKKKSRNKWQWKHNSKPMGCCKNSPKKEFIAIQSYFKKQWKHRIDNLTLHLKQREKEEQRNPRISRRKEFIKIQAEINEKEMKETIVKISKRERRIKSTKLEMKKERLQQRMQKYKGL